MRSHVLTVLNETGSRVFGLVDKEEGEVALVHPRETATKFDPEDRD